MQYLPIVGEVNHLQTPSLTVVCESSRLSSRDFDSEIALVIGCDFFGSRGTDNWEFDSRDS